MYIQSVQFGNKQHYKTYEAFDDIQNEQLIKLYKQYQEKPFQYAIINYSDNGKTKVKTYPKQNFFKSFINKLFKMIKK